LAELPPLLTEADLHIAQLGLTVLTAVCQLQQPAAALVHSGFMVEVLLPPVFKLTKSPLLQGAALRTTSRFFTVLVTRQIFQADRLLAMLLEPISGASAKQIHKQAYSSISQCVAAVCLTDGRVTKDMVQRFLRDIKSSQTPDHRRTFALLAVAEMGRHVDLSGVEGLRQVILTSFGSHSEEVKQATSYALGSVACGNLAEFLPFVLNEIETQHKRQYLLLHSLKEIISCSSARESLQQYEEGIWNNLFRHCESPEEGTRNVVAECLGKLTLIQPQALLPRLRQALLAPQASPLMRTTIVTAIKFTITDQPQAIDPLLRQCIGDFLATIGDPQLEVRRVALVALNSAAHNKPSLVRDLLDTLLPKLYTETQVRKELIREVEMGPFKHTVDDGLDLRKAGYECMYTLLDSCLDRLDIYVFLNHVEDGLKDDYDIKMLTYLMLVRLSSLVPNAVLQRLDRLVDPLRTTCSAKVKQNSVKQEFEKQDELKRSALRVVVALLAIPDADKNLQLSEFLSHIKSSPDLQALYDSIQQDAAPEGGAMMDLS